MESREEITARIKDQADIVQIIGEAVSLKKSGARFLGLCPFHHEKTPSFSVHPGQQFFHCFGCGESGDVFSFLMKFHNMDFPSSVKELARRYNIELPQKHRSKEDQKRDKLRKQMYLVNDKASKLFSEFLQKSGKASSARDYLQQRGISKAIQEKFRIGYAPSPEHGGWNFLGSLLAREEVDVAVQLGLLVKKENGGSYDRFRDRIMFPLLDVRGRVIGFGGRILGDGQPKYMNSPESIVFNKSKSLLGIYQQKDDIRKEKSAILVEGNFDLVSLVQYGCGNVVAPLGTALTNQQLRLVKRAGAEDVFLLFDGDKAGIKAAMSSVPLFLAEQINGKVALLPQGHDPDTFVKENGMDGLKKILLDAVPLPEFMFDQLVKKFGLTLDGKTKIIERLRPLVKAASSSLQRSVIVAHFSEQLGVSVEQINLSLDNQYKTKPIPREHKEKKKTRLPLSATQKRVVTFMVMHPVLLDKLERVDIRGFLTGTIGEILFLQIKSMIKAGKSVEPEELLSLLPAGEERVWLAEIFLSIASCSQEDTGVEDVEKEMEAISLWLEQRRLRCRAKEIEAELKEDGASLIDLLTEKKEIDSALRTLDETYLFSEKKTRL